MIKISNLTCEFKMRLCFWSKIYISNFYDPFGDVKKLTVQGARLKFTAMRMFHFLAFHEAPFAIFERFQIEKYTSEPVPGEFSSLLDCQTFKVLIFSNLKI